jgi:hypothetical protein
MSTTFPFAFFSVELTQQAAETCSTPRLFSRLLCLRRGFVFLGRSITTTTTTTTTTTAYSSKPELTTPHSRASNFGGGI